MAEITLTRENFETEVLQSDVPVLVDFWAEWCGPCQQLGPVIEEMAHEAEADGAYKVGKVNVDEQPELSETYKVMSIPMVAIFKNGKITAVSVGYKPKAKIKALI